MNNKKQTIQYQPSFLHKNGNLSPIKPRQKMNTIYRHRLTKRNPQQYRENDWLKDKSYLRKRLDQDIQYERQTMIMKSGRTSIDNPDWMTINYNYYVKENFSPKKKETIAQQRQFDVLNNSKQKFYGRNEDTYFKKMYDSNMDRKNEWSNSSKKSKLRSTLSHFLSNASEVSQKVGSTIQRNYQIRRPSLKVGSDMYVDTYSPF